MDALRRDGTHYDVTCSKCGIIFRIQTHEFPHEYLKGWICPNIRCQYPLDYAMIERKD